MSKAVPNPTPAGPTSHRLMSNLRMVSLGTLVSRILGLVRDMGMTSVFGAGTVLDAFIIAFRIPNLARQLLGEGALSTAFLPIFVKCREEQGTGRAREMMTAVAVTVALLLSGLMILTEATLAVLYWLPSVATSTKMLLLLLMVMLPYSLLICLSALFCAALHAQRQFLWPVIVPITLNTIWLIAIAFVVRWREFPLSQATFLAATVTFAGCIQLLIPILALRHQQMGITSNWRSGLPQVREVFRAMVPVVVGMSLVQSGAIFDSLFAWGLSQPDDGSAPWCQILGISPMMESGTASALYIGQRMYQFPLGVFGIALGTVLYPVLSQHAQRGQLDLLRNDLSRGLRIMLAVALPASAGLCLLAWPLTLALFQHGEFDLEDARLTSRMIAIYGTGVWCYIGIAILNRALYAIGDRQTPMRFGFIALISNLALNLMLVAWMGGAALALGSVLAAALQVLLTLRTLTARVGSLHWNEIVTTLWKSLFATALMSVACLGTMSALPAPDSLRNKLILLGGTCLAGALTYFLTAKATGMTEIQEVISKT